MILAIDPGPEQSAFVRIMDGRVVSFGKVDNEEMLHDVRGHLSGGATDDGKTTLAIEMIASYGMPVGREVFETCLWVGRYIEAWGSKYTLVYRRDVKLHLCGSARAKDGNVRAALIDLYGGKAKAIGKKANPGPLYGVSADVWSALAVAVTYENQISHAC